MFVRDLIILVSTIISALELGIISNLESLLVTMVLRAYKESMFDRWLRSLIGRLEDPADNEDHEEADHRHHGRWVPRLGSYDLVTFDFYGLGRSGRRPLRSDFRTTENPYLC